jgi:hypothetical protein
MSTKLYDLVVKTGEYTSNGETKGRYENVGSMMQGDSGQFLILKRTFNPAGVSNPDNKDSIIISCFEPKDQQQQNQGHQKQAPQQSQQYQQPQQAPQQAPQPHYQEPYRG